LVDPACRIRFEYSPYFIPNPPEYCELLLLRPFGVRGIVEGKMMPISLAREHGARLVCVAADRDHRIDRLIQEFAKVLRAMRADIDADFIHHLDGEGMNVTRRLRSRADNSQTVAGHGSKNSFGKMTPAGVASAENEDNGNVGHVESEDTEFCCRQGRFARAASAA
jgi:hypothetical protein